MRTMLFVLLAVASLGTLAQAADVDGAAPVRAAVSSDPPQSAVWQRRKLEGVTHPQKINSETMGYREVSCDQLYDSVRFVLLKFGARESDLKVDQRPCYSYSILRSVDVTFSVLAPQDQPGRSAGGLPVAAHWETIALKGDCQFLRYATIHILPRFTTRNVKLISREDCERLGVGLYAQVLKANEEPEPQAD